MDQKEEIHSMNIPELSEPLIPKQSEPLNEYDLVAELCIKTRYDTSNNIYDKVKNVFGIKGER